MTSRLEDELRHAQHITELRDAFTRAMKERDFLHVSYTLIRFLGTDAGDSVYFTTYPQQWVDRYSGENYWLKDPVVLTALGRLTPFRWSEELSLPLRKGQVFEEARQHDIVDGLAIPLRGRESTALVSLTVSSEASKLNRKWIPEFEHLSLVLHEQAERLFAGPEREARIRSLGLNDREFQVASWTAVGLYAREVGEILGISTRTVYNHRNVAGAKHGSLDELLNRIRILGLAPTDVAASVKQLRGGQPKRVKDDDEKR